MVASYQNPLLGNVLSQIHIAFMKEIKKKFKSNSTRGKKHPPEEIIQKARIKVALKIQVKVPKNPTIECDHNKSGLGFFPHSRNFKQSKQCTENIQKALIKLRFKSFAL